MATRTSTPRCRAWTGGRWTCRRRRRQRSPSAFAYGWSASATCVASSRVGTRTSPRGPARLGAAAGEPGEQRRARTRASCPSRSGRGRGCRGRRARRAGSRPGSGTAGDALLVSLRTISLGQAELGERGHARRGRGPQDLGVLAVRRVGRGGVGESIGVGRRRGGGVGSARRNGGGIAGMSLNTSGTGASRGEPDEPGRVDARPRGGACGMAGRSIQLSAAPGRSAVSGRVTSAAARSRPAASSSSAPGSPTSDGNPRAANHSPMRRTSRARYCGPFGLPTTSTTCGRSITTNRPSWTSRLNADRSPWASPSRASPRRASTSWIHRSASSSGSGRSWASRGAARRRRCRGTPAAARCRRAARDRAPARPPPEPGERAELGVAHWPDSSSRPNAVRVAIARISRERRTRRPSR